jgi:hypothetical protein
MTGMLTNIYGLEFGTDHTGKFIIPTSEQVRAAVGSRVVTMTGGLNLNETLLDITIMSINLSMQAAWLAAQHAQGGEPTTRGGW